MVRTVQRNLGATPVWAGYRATDRARAATDAESDLAGMTAGRMLENAEDRWMPSRSRDDRRLRLGSLSRPGHPAQVN
jgi:hypothetical protein